MATQSQPPKPQPAPLNTNARELAEAMQRQRDNHSDVESAQAKRDAELLKQASEAQSRVDAQRAEAAKEKAPEKRTDPYGREVSASEIADNRAKMAKMPGADDEKNKDVTRPGRQTLGQAMEFGKDLEQAKDFAAAKAHVDAIPEKKAVAAAPAAPAPAAKAKSAPVKHAAATPAAAEPPAAAPVKERIPTIEDFHSSPSLAALASGKQVTQVAQAGDTGHALTADEKGATAVAAVEVQRGGPDYVRSAAQGTEPAPGQVMTFQTAVPGQVQGKDLGPAEPVKADNSAQFDRTVAHVKLEEGRETIEGARQGTTPAPGQVASFKVADGSHVQGQDIGTLDKPANAKEQTQVAGLKPLERVELNGTKAAMTADALNSSAHPSEADKNGNVLGKESPTQEPTPRFDSATYARALQFLNEKAEAPSAGQEQGKEATPAAALQDKQADKQGGQQQQAQKEQQRVQEMEHSHE